MSNARTSEVLPETHEVKVPVLVAHIGVDDAEVEVRRSTIVLFPVSSGVFSGWGPRLN